MLRAQFLVDAVPADDAAVCELMLALLGIHSVKSVRDQLYELPPQAQSILSALADTGGELTARDLAKQTGYSQDIVRALLSRAVAAGGAERVREGCSQGRSKVATTYRITERGRHLVVKNER